MNRAVDRLKDSLDALVRMARTPGIQYVAVDASSVLFEYSGGTAEIATARPMRPDSTMMAYSMSKTITAAAVLQLVDSNRIQLGDPVARHLEWQPYGGEITVRHLLSHTSGIPNPIPLRWVHPIAAHETFDERAALTGILQKHRRLVFRPGTKFAYSNIGYWLLGAIVEQVTGQPFDSYVASRVLFPLGIEPKELAYTVTDPAAHAAGYLEKYSLMNLFKGWLIDRELIGEYSGPWLRIRDHYPDGPAFGGLVGSAAGFGKFLQDQLRKKSCLFGERTHALLVEQQRTVKGVIPMTLGWHMGSAGPIAYLFKEGGGGGFHSMMRLYPSKGIGTVLMTNATAVKVGSLLDTLDQNFL